MAKVINLTPLEDEVITLVKGARSVSFPDRLPASLVPHLMRIMDPETNEISLTPDNMERLFQIIARIICFANPDWTEDEAMDFLSVQDLIPIVQALLNPQARSSMPSPTPIAPTPSKSATRTRRGS